MNTTLDPLEQANFTNQRNLLASMGRKMEGDPCMKLRRRLVLDVLDIADGKPGASISARDRRRLTNWRDAMERVMGRDAGTAREARRVIQQTNALNWAVRTTIGA